MKDTSTARTFSLLSGKPSLNGVTDDRDEKEEGESINGNSSFYSHTGGLLKLDGFLEKLKKLQSIELPQPLELADKEEFTSQENAVEEFIGALDILFSKLDISSDNEKLSIHNVVKLHDVIKKHSAHIGYLLLEKLDIIQDYCDYRVKHPRHPYLKYAQYAQEIKQFSLAARLFNFRKLHENWRGGITQQKLDELMAEIKLSNTEIAVKGFLATMGGIGVGSTILGISAVFATPAIIIVVVAASGGASLLLGGLVAAYFYYRDFHSEDIGYQDKLTEYQGKVTNFINEIDNIKNDCEQQWRFLISKCSKWNKKKFEEYKSISTFTNVVEALEMYSNSSSSFSQKDVQLKGELQGQAVLFKEVEVARDHRCGFTAINVSPQEAVNILLTQKDNVGARNDLAEEILQQVGFDILSDKASRWQTEKLKKANASLSDMLVSNYKAYKHDSNDPQAHEKSKCLLKELQDFCKKPEVYEKYVQDLGLPNAWLGCKSAKLIAQYSSQPFNLYIWEKDKIRGDEIKDEKSAPADKIKIKYSYAGQKITSSRHLLYTDKYTHFNSLAEQKIPANTFNTFSLTPFEWLSINQPRPQSSRSERPLLASQQKKPWYKRFFQSKHWMPFLITLGSAGLIFGLAVTIIPLTGIVALSIPVGLITLGISMLAGIGISYTRMHFAEKNKRKNEKLKTYEEEVIKPLEEVKQKLNTLKRDLSTLADIIIKLQEQKEEPPPQPTSQKTGAPIPLFKPTSPLRNEVSTTPPVSDTIFQKICNRVLRH
jgi:hypothetical protein